MPKDKLTDQAVKGLKPRQKPYKKADGGGLLVTPPTKAILTATC